MLENKNKYYFYNGFESPSLIDFNDFTIETNYRGDITEEVIEIHNDWKDESDDDYNEYLNGYSIYKNPKVNDFMWLNESKYGLKKDEYLDTFIEENVIKGDIVKREIFRNVSLFEIEELILCLENDLFSVYENEEQFLEDHMIEGSEEDGEEEFVLDLDYIYNELEWFTMNDKRIVKVYWEDVNELSKERGI